MRPATSADSDLLLRWRNDPVTRQNSLTQDEVKLADHQRWLAASLQSADRRLFIAESQTAPIGTVRLDRRGKDWELSWTIAPEARGQGFGSEMVRQATTLVDTRLIAQIRDDNEASRKIALAAGFELEAAEKGVEIWRLR